MCSTLKFPSFTRFKSQLNCGHSSAHLPRLHYHPSSIIMPAKPLWLLSTKFMYFIISSLDKGSAFPATVRADDYSWAASRCRLFICRHNLIFTTGAGQSSSQSEQGRHILCWSLRLRWHWLSFCPSGTRRQSALSLSLFLSRSCNWPQKCQCGCWRCGSLIRAVEWPPCAATFVPRSCDRMRT